VTTTFMYVLECNDWSRVANVTDRASATVPVMPNDVWSSYVNRKGGWSRIDREGGTRGGRVLQRVQSRCSACRVGTRRGLQRVQSRYQAGLQRVQGRCSTCRVSARRGLQRVPSRCQAGVPARAESVPGGSSSACRVSARRGKPVRCEAVVSEFSPSVAK